ncbi:P-loop NTPase [Geomonas paludis]|uniref:P-loop NTPase n=1 Tax=Geomonas paludis TaxID=2740185 RepID=A0A6V8MWI9_9BACT|nr:P-loop NTPase [Geomonas paludis]UPU34464.1 P-loop NTPase [Geomonas paludis]GFO64452.1 hypothetical protein GMPD_23710 [Geomonas paludis]
MKQVTAYVVDSDADATAHIRQMLGSMADNVRLLGAARTLQEGLQDIQTCHPNIVLLEVKDLERGAKETEFLLSRCPNSATFVSSATLSPEWILKLIRAGASEYLSRPVSASELADAVRKVAKSHAVSSSSVGHKGEIFAVYHPSGGVGTTTVAVNLAATLAVRGYSTALMDLNFCGADVSAYLDLTPRYTMACMVPKAGQVDANFLKSIMMPHSCGVEILDGPDQPREASRIGPGLIQETLALLRTCFDYTVIDTGGELSEKNLAAFELSDRVLFTTVLNIPGLRTGQRYLRALAGEGHGPERVKLVVNRHLPRDEIKVTDAEKVMGTRALHVLPNSYADLRVAITRGTPVIRCLPKSPFSKSMDQLARLLCPEKANAKTAP